MTSEPFNLPTTIEDAERLLLDLKADVDKIHNQLGVEKNEDPEWRRKARHALTRKLDQLRRVKHMAKEARSHKYTLDLDINLDDPDALLQRMYALVSYMRARGSIMLHEDEVKLLDVVSRRIEKRETG